MRREVIATASAVRLKELLEKSGIRVFSFETVKEEPPEDPSPLCRAAAALQEFDWLLFTSRRAVEALAARLEHGEFPPGPRIACVGEATAAAATKRGATVDLVPTDASGAGLARVLLKHLSPGARILWPRAEKAKRDLLQLLEEVGHQVEAPIAYRTMAPAQSPDLDNRLRQFRDGFHAGRFSAITFCSPSAVDNLVDLLGGDETRRILSQLLLAAIGKTTAAHLERIHRAPDIIPPSPSIEGLASALIEELQERIS